MTTGITNNTFLMIFNKIPVKENRAKKLAVYLSLGLLFSISAVYFYWFENGIFFYQENESLFIFSYEYLQKFIVIPGGLLEYAGNFLKQGYYNYAYGSLIVSFLLILLFSVFIKINNRLCCDKSFSILLILLPSCLLLLMQTHYEHFIHHSLGILLVVLWFWISIISVDKRLRFLCLTLFPVFYYLTGSCALIYMGLYIMYSLIYDKGILRYQLSAFLIAATILTFIVFKEVIFLQPADRLLKYPLLSADLTKLPVFLYLLSAYIVLFPMIVKGLSSFKVNRKYAVFIPLITILTVFAVTVYLLKRHYDHDHAYLMQLEKSVFSKNWDTVIKQYESSPTVNNIGQYYYNLSLSEEGKLCDRMFFGCQDFGAKSLILPRDLTNINRSVYFYYTIGLISEAHHLAYESMVIYGYQP